MDMDNDQAFDVSLSADERRVLAAGLFEWGGAARATDRAAVTIGFKDEQDLLAGVKELRSAVMLEQPMRAPDWRKALIATEIAFASDLLGSGVDWPTTTGISDVQTIALLRQVQIKVMAALAANR